MNQDASKVLVICTGNAARSPMAANMLQVLADAVGMSLQIRSGGTHAIEGQPMGMRTKEAMIQIPELKDLPLGRHRSHQMTTEDVDWADLIICMEHDHLRYVRRVHPGASSRTACITTLCDHLSDEPRSLRQRVGAMDLHEVIIEEVTEVSDPAGGDNDTYVSCANELWELCQILAPRL